MSFNSHRSSNSDGKSKRSLNSNPSNPSERSNSSNKKNKINQKTLGMAWGSNSLSSSKSSFRKSPFTDFGSYMVEKNRKLKNQFDADAENSLSNSNSERSIFHGVSIFVDGFTVPSSQELRGYMLKYGGRFENYFSRHRVTHIICSNLADSKIKNLRSFSRGLPVVKPAWVLDSVAANRLLAWIPYQLDQLVNETHNQQKLSDFFALKRISSSEGDATLAYCQVKLETEGSSSKGGESRVALLSEMGDVMKDTGQDGGECDRLGHEKTSEVLREEPTFSNENLCEVNTAKPSSTDIEDENSVREEFQSSPHRPSASVSSCCLGNQISKGSLSSTNVGPSYHCHSTLEDPNFVENYFKYSRLHFIGTWRNRYRKRFPSMHNGVIYNNPIVNSTTVSRNTAIIHVDMDCFFVSVVIRNHPELQDKPVAVCHSNNPRGTAEISSANYPARDYGVRAGIFVRDAKALCPHLVIFPYNFEAYEEVADQFYNILHKHCNKVQAVSCDEAFLDVTDIEEEDPERLALIIREEIFEMTRCTASAGIAGNLLLARLATRTAKPNGQCSIPSEKVDDYLSELPIKALPGIGHVLEEKLKKRHIRTCGQLRMISKESLRKDFGTKTGDMLWNYSRGVDNRLVGVVQDTKSIGAEVNWGVRFNDSKDSQHFLINLCKEVSLRLQGCGLQGRTITLKVKKRRKGAGEPAKYMGCGDCENLSHSITVALNWKHVMVPIATDDVDVLQRISNQLFSSFNINAKEIRGVGLQVSKLESADMAKQDVGKQSVDGNSGQLSIHSSGPSGQMHTNQYNDEACLNRVSSLPPICRLDRGVIESLPPEIFSEINEMYGGKLIDFIKKNEDKHDRISSSMCTASHEEVEGARNKGKRPLSSHLVHLNNIPTENKAKQCTLKEIQPVYSSGTGLSNLDISTMGADKIDLMPASLSQVDISILQQLPENVKVDILELLPAHRRPECSSDAALGPVTKYSDGTVGTKSTENHIQGLDSVSKNSLWIGNPPEWVEKFKVSNCLILNILAEMYYKSGLTDHLSSILQSTIFESRLSQDVSNDGWDEAICSLCELFKQYIELKIESDIEEIYICFRLLRRFTMKSSLFLQVYNIILPFLQVLESEGTNDCKMKWIDFIQCFHPYDVEKMEWGNYQNFLIFKGDVKSPNFKGNSRTLEEFPP
ncbi:hypothetical protein HHK36_008340 [Tetracentron sinense]|uniref:DNA repair protein REV1 n=1 Tax=Tetracentron sinense TaxID=13715 RepID=A0A834ZIV8_TETSI|nr:hypothetical protein HHK36_008340 [Tetracentron sinense]